MTLTVRWLCSLGRTDLRQSPVNTKKTYSHFRIRNKSFFKLNNYLHCFECFANNDTVGSTLRRARKRDRQTKTTAAAGTTTRTRTTTTIRNETKSNLKLVEQCLQ